MLIALKYFRAARGFTFYIEQDNQTAQMGNDLKLNKTSAVLKVELPAKALARIIFNGTLWEKTETFARTIDAPAVYRA